ncbi:hypothetical protein TNIN_264971 [Trichonephila inaurata madagascariensis]|uniref:Uncharacterized protein n=1 Tax=Trichonephila inaurata madagascariensis TaxID=2747483 RepID=A0A8X6WW63_9ARAC|nr:hypothetical protein TNIN_264971 [Trichonephila inaurata madagascariensis]
MTSPHVTDSCSVKVIGLQRSHNDDKNQFSRNREVIIITQEASCTYSAVDRFYSSILSTKVGAMCSYYSSRRYRINNFLVVGKRRLNSLKEGKSIIANIL